MTDPIDTAVRADLDPGPLTEHEREQLWARLERELPAAPPRRRRRLLLIPAVAAVAATLAIAILPGGTRPGPDLQPASAAEVLRIASANVGLGAPGPGERLVAEEKRVVPYGDGDQEVELTRSFAATDGSGSITTSTPGDEPSELDFAAGSSSVGELDPFEDWRGVIDTADLPQLPTDPDALLDDLRERTRRALGRGDRRILKLLGPDLPVVAAAQSLIIRAPISAEQRAALFALLADMPEWTLPGSSATPLEVTRRGTDGDAVVIRIESRLTRAEQREASTASDSWTLEIVVDAPAGRIVALREFEEGPDSPPQVTTVERQEIVPAR